MKRNIWLLAVMAAILWGQAAWAQDMYVIVGGGGLGTKITSVPYTISATGFYYLGSNLTHTGTTNAITVAADNVTLDLMGFSLTHTGAVALEIGIYMNGRSNVEIRNGTVSGFADGIREAGATGNKHRVLNIRASNNNTYGIYLLGAGMLVRGCNVSNNNSSDGINIVSGIVDDCIVFNNYRGIIISGPGALQGNTAFSNAFRNFQLGTGAATSILADRNSGYGRLPDYYVPLGTTGVVITANNSGTQ